MNLESLKDLCDLRDALQRRKWVVRAVIGVGSTGNSFGVLEISNHIKRYFNASLSDARIIGSLDWMLDGEYLVKDGESYRIA